jgi:general secretion pathway protein G
VLQIERYVVDKQFVRLELPCSWLIVICVTLLSLPQSAEAWSSSASRTQYDLRMVEGSIEIFRHETGTYPDPEKYWIQLRDAGVLYRRQTNDPPVDGWGHRLVYRYPGKRGTFDLYSVGPDGIDQNGGQDDVTLEGVNDGFHWKATWPAGRLVLRVGVGLALGVCLLGFVWPLRFVLPIGGMILCGAVVIGCQLLMHPGRVSRNQPLQFYAFVAAVAFCAFFVVLLFGIWRSRDIIWSRLGGRTRRG